MSIEQRVGDLFGQDDIEAIGHGVNCKGLMGAGIATQFKKRFPIMYAQYKLQCDAGLLMPGGVFAWEGMDGEDKKFVFNIASQDDPGANARYNFLYEGLIKAITAAQALKIPQLAIPRIGAGIGGLNWDNALEGITYIAASRNFHLVVVTHPSDVK